MSKITTEQNKTTEEKEKQTETPVKVEVLSWIYKMLYHKWTLFFVYLAIGFLAFILFQEQILDIFNWVNSKLKLTSETSYWFLDIAFAIACFYIFITSIHRVRTHEPSEIFLGTITFAALAYLYYLFINQAYVFAPLYFCSSVKYFDLLPIFAAAQWFLYIIPNKEIKLDKDKNALYEDHALGETGKDELGYSSYAEFLASKILSTNVERSFAIGINGGWGTGKTSFLDLLKRKLESETTVLIDFKPWNSHSPNAIIMDFFETIQDKIRPDDAALSKLLMEYSNKLVVLDEAQIAKSIQSIFTMFSSSSSTNSLYEQIDEMLEFYNKKLIIFIDDLDRLDTNELLEVIRLIRNTANFRNTFFMVAYDRNYVVNALEKLNSYKQERFLEKIFQLEVSMPYFDKKKLREELAKKLKEKFSNDQQKDLYKEIDETIVGTSYSKPVLLQDALENMRDVTRLANSIILNLGKLQGEVVFRDFLYLEVLRLKYPSVYELLYRKTHLFLTTADSFGIGTGRYELSEVLDANGRQKGTTCLEDYLLRTHKDLAISENEIREVLALANLLFYKNITSEPLSIVYPSKFNRYFAYNLLGALSEVDFSKARSLPQSDFNKKITEWLDSGLEFDIKDKFERIRNFDDKDDFEKVIRAIIHLATRPNKNTYYNKRIVDYDVNDLLLKLSNEEDRLSKMLYRGNKNDMENFVKSIFDEAKSPYWYEAHILYHANKSWSVFPLKKEERIEICTHYLRKYCNDTDKINMSVWRLFHTCKLINENGKEYVSENVKEVMKDFCLKKDLDGFLLIIIDPQPFNENGFAISKVILDIFDSWDAFEKELNHLDESNYLKEFKTFYQKFKDANFSLYVEFEFKEIPIDERRAK